MFVREVITKKLTKPRTPYQARVAALTQSVNRSLVLQKEIRLNEMNLSINIRKLF